MILTMKKIYIILMGLLILCTTVNAQEKKDKIKVKLTGFVGAETYFDTRTNITARDGAILLYPAAPSYDTEGNDLNDRSSLFMTTIQSRLRATVSGFNVFGAKGIAAIEGDFVGTTNDKTGLFRLRHAFIKLDWEKDQLIAGKFWHPLFIPSAFPRVLHWGAGIPFGVLCRAPQLRYTHKMGNSSLSIAALSEMDFKSTGPNGSSVEYVQNSGVPELTLQFKTLLTDGLEFGATVGNKTLKPSLVNSKGVKTDETLNSFYFNTWLGLTAKKFKWNVQGIYGQNMYNFLTIGGYGVKNIKENGDYEYTNISTLNLTSDIFTTTGKVRYGFNAGYSKNLGASDDLAMVDGDFVGLYSRGSNIDNLYQFAPRIEFHSGRMIIGGEAIYTSAAYGETQVDATIDNAKSYNSTRLLLHIRYTF